TLGVSRISLDNRLANERLSTAKLVSIATTADVIAAVCTGQVEAGLVGQSSMLDTRSSGGPQRALSAVTMNAATYWFGIEANKSLTMARAAADVLREEIGAMADDGRLAGIDFRWHTSIGTEASTIFQYGRLRFYSNLLLAAFGVLLAALAATFWLTRRLRAAQ